MHYKVTGETFPTQPWVLHALLVRLPTLCKCNTKSSLSRNTKIIWWVEVKTHTTRNVNSSVPLNFLTLNISFMLLSMNTTIRSSFSFGRDLLWRTALVKDLFTVSLFSIWGSNSTSLMSACRSDDFQCWELSLTGQKRIKLRAKCIIPRGRHQPSPPCPVLSLVGQLPEPWIQAACAARLCRREAAASDTAAEPQELCPTSHSLARQERQTSHTEVTDTLGESGNYSRDTGLVTIPGWLILGQILVNLNKWQN